MTPTPRAAAVLAALALCTLLLPVGVVVLGVLALVAATAVDAWAVRRPPELHRRVPSVLSRGVPVALTVEAPPTSGRLRVRQATPPDVGLDPQEAEGDLRATLVSRRRGRHVIPALADRREGPLGLGRWHHRVGDEEEVVVYPDLPAARRLVLAVRHGRFREQGQRGRGPLGLGTEFESIREYVPDDDIRQVNWLATARMGRPMSNQYRVEQDRDVICLLDVGRLMAAPIVTDPARPADRTRLDVALDALAAVGLVVDEVGDRCGAVAFDARIRRQLNPRRSGGDAAVRATFDLEPAAMDSDYDLAFRTVARAKRAFVLVLCDLLEEAAARPLVEAVPVLARRHAVVVASASDPELEAMVRTPPEQSLDVYRAAAALEVLNARGRVTGLLRAAGAEVIEAPPDALGAACVRAYLKAKARARL